MISISKPGDADILLLAEIARVSFIESHGHSAASYEINKYVEEKYSPGVMAQEINDARNIYHIIYQDEKAAGYSKIIFDSPYKTIKQQNVTKLERIYLLKEFYGSTLGAELFNFNLALSKNKQQAGMWLYVWKENPRAIAFYEKNGFTIIAEGDFRLTPTHSNPNHIMYLQY